MLPDSELFYKQLAEQIKFERVKKDISQQNLADYLGLSRTSVMNIETSRHKPSLYQVLQIATYLNIDYTTLIPFKSTKADDNNSDSVELKEGLTDQGSIDELDKSSKAAITNFLSGLK
ncbi:Helix-turn-helix [Chitinophaga eiseniae]|jgi:transcriptional regulator with XRE-family HTH domain|uniref:Helix-turn-helix n=1 Tax=Chitinophaga eiseniae TaxID=634771 RepID=A0A1T4QZV1_9BACT|nr:helix-turn-helix transcriptional regulator [Chitinophaga eiseniae]SKA09254.1 Helix-turn-helix [Chitinophaga eiseniae]